MTDDEFLASRARVGLRLCPPAERRWRLRDLDGPGGEARERAVARGAQLYLIACLAG